MIAECAGSSLPHPDPQLQGDEECCGMAGASPRICGGDCGLGYCCYCKVRQMRSHTAMEFSAETVALV